MVNSLVHLNPKLFDEDVLLHQKTALTDGFTSGLTRFVNNNEPTLRTITNIPYLTSIVNTLKGVDPTGIEPVRPTFLGSAPEPGGPTRSLIYKNITRMSKGIIC